MVVLTGVIIGWALAYGALRAWWALGHTPAFPSLDKDLVVLSAWQPVVLCAAAAAVAVALYAAPGRWPPVVAAGAVAAGIVVSCPLLLLDVVGAVIVGLGLPVNPAAFGSRAGYLAVAATLAVAAVRRSRWLRAACPRCGRGPAHQRPTRVPGWARLGAYLAVAGCLTRLGAQIVVGFAGVPLTPGPAEIVFNVGFLLAGTVLPLATVQAWGRVFPRWTPPLTGRRVPRWLVLGPAAFLATGLTVYFGICLVQLIADPAGWTDGGPFPLAFFWVAIPAYLLWGLGLTAGAISYRATTRPPCRTCHRT